MKSANECSEVKPLGPFKTFDECLTAFLKLESVSALTCIRGTENV